MAKYKVIWFPFNSAPIIETDDIVEARTFIEQKYRDKNDIDGRKWFRVDDGYIFPKLEKDNSYTLNKLFNYAINCDEQTTDEFDYLFLGKSLV